MEWPEELPNAKVKSNLSRSTPEGIPIPAEPTLKYNYQWGEYVRGRIAVPPVGATNVYGTDPGIQWDWNKDEGKWYEKEGGQIQMPIHGPIHWYASAKGSGLWKTWSDIGTDFLLRGNPTNPLHPTQTQMMNDHSPDLRVTQWVKNVGSGSFGEVWIVRYHKSVLQNITGTDRAEKVDTIEEGACKVLRLRETSRARASHVMKSVDAMMGDIYALRYLKHENIVGLDDVINIPDSRTRFPFSTILLLMEACDGELQLHVKELFWMANVQISVEIHRKWMRDLTKAVNYLHSINVLHLDIKPRNILFKWKTQGTQSSVANIIHRYNDITFKLGDLGGAQAFPIEGNILAPSRITDLVNTAAYSAPEVIMLKQTAKPRPPIEGKPCDIYSIGASLAKMVMEGNDFENHYIARDLYKHIQDMASGQVVGHNIPQEVLDLMLPLMNPVWNLRPTIVDLLNNPWLKVKEEEQRLKEEADSKKRKLYVIEEEEEGESEDNDDQEGQGPPKRHES